MPIKRCVLSVFLLAAAPALAQTEFRYSAHFLCGKANGGIVKSYAKSPGVYFTTITVSNLHEQAQVNGVIRVAVGAPPPKRSQNAKPLEWSVDPSGLFQVDCGDIYKRFEIEPGKFIDGFVHIVAGPVEPSVAAVYTLFDANYPASIDVEHLAPW